MQDRTAHPTTALHPEGSSIDDHPLIEDVTYDARTEETVAALSDSTVEHSLVVVDLVSRRERRPQSELAPLYDVIDPENLDRIFDERPADSAIVFSFEYEGYNVTVTADSVAVIPVQ